MRILKIKFIISICVGICAFSCFNNNYIYLVDTIESDFKGNYEIKIDSVSIPISPDYSGKYYTYSLFEDKGETYFYGYNPANISIDIININERKATLHINLSNISGIFLNLDRQDLNKGNSIADIFVMSRDSIILNHSNKQLVCIDTSGNIHKLIDFNSIPGIRQSNSFIYSYSNYSKAIDAVSARDLLFQKGYYAEDWSIKRPIFSILDYDNLTMKDLPLYFSDWIYDHNGQAGFMGQINVSEFQKEPYLTYSFMYESNIYQYNPENSTISIFGGKSKTGENIISPIKVKESDNQKVWVKHSLENPQFYHVLYDKYRKLYYRFHLGSIPFKNGKYFNSMSDKPLTLMVFDEKFRIIQEISFPKRTYSLNTWFVTEEGLFVAPYTEAPGSEKMLKFHIIKISDDR